MSKKTRHEERYKDVPVDGMKDATHIRVSVGYDAGGTNIWTGNEDRRGYTVALFPIRKWEDSGRSGFETTIGDSRGIRALLVPAKRYSFPTLIDTAAVVLAHADDLAGFLKVGDPRGGARAAVELFKPVAAVAS